MYFVNYFFVSSILGFLLETCFYFFFKWSGNSGYLFGPWTPVYGIGSIIIIMIYDFLSNKIKKNKFLKFVVFFFLVSIILSIIELIGGYLIEFIFHETFWDYSNHKLNIGKYASVEMAFVWGIASTLFIYIIRPLIDKFIFYISKSIIYILTILFIIDNIATLIIKLKLL